MLSLLLIFLSFSSIESSQKYINFDNIDMSEATIEFSPDIIRSERHKKQIKLFHDKQGFFVRTNSKEVRVHAHDTDKSLREMTSKDIAKYAMLGKLKVSKFNNGEYAIRAHGDLRGGGALGATGGALFGKFLVHFIGQGAIQVVALCTGPAYPATLVALEASVVPLIIEPLSNVAAVGFGVAGAVATGPV